jgi:hypothetical protein
VQRRLRRSRQKVQASPIAAPRRIKFASLGALASLVRGRVGAVVATQTA